MKTLTILTALLLTGCGEEDKDTGDDTGTTTIDTGDTDTGDTGDTGNIGNVVSMVVDNHMVVCSAEGQWLCPNVQLEGADWSALYCGVGSLDYQWGTTYTLTAEIVGYSDPAGDGCGDVYELVSIESETFDGASRAFELNWVYDVNITADNAGGGFLMDNVPFTCADKAVCDVVAKTGADWSTLYHLSLENPAKQGDPLILTAIELEK